MNRLPPLVELRAFEAAARHLSFKRAAAELGVTPTAISHQVRLLEQHCGRPLFSRRPRPLSLTEAGAHLFPVVRAGLEAFATAIETVRQDTTQRPLRVTTTNAFASRWLVPRLPRWRQLNPAVPLEVIGTDNVLDLQAGEADVAIRYARTVPTDGTARELLHDTFWPICSADLVRAGLKNAADLRKHVLVHSYWSPADADAPTWRHWLSVARSRWPNVPALGDMEHLSFREELHAIEAVTAGQGIGIFSDVLVAPELAAGTLVKAFDLALPGYRFYFVSRAGHSRDPVMQVFLDWLHAACRRVAPASS